MKLLRRLKVLDLRHGRIGDAGAAALAASPDLKKLELLDLSRNELTAEGIKALKATGIQVVLNDQHAPTPEDDEEREYLGMGDIE